MIRAHIQNLGLVFHCQLPRAHYTHIDIYIYIKRTPNFRCVFASVLEGTTKMTAHNRATGLPDPDLAGDPHITQDSSFLLNFVSYAHRTCT